MPLRYPQTPTSLSYDIMVFDSPDQCPDCAQKFPGQAPNQTFNAACSSLVTRSSCEGEGRCSWVGVSWAGCLDPVEAVLVRSAEASCSVYRQDQAGCEAFPASCAYEVESGACRVANMTADQRARIGVVYLWLAFDDEVDVALTGRSVDAPVQPFQVGEAGNWAKS